MLCCKKKEMPPFKREKRRNHLGFPTFPLTRDENKRKMVKIVHKFASNVFTFPFLSNYIFEDVCDPNSTSDIKEKLHKNGYVNAEQVFLDMEKVFTQKRPKDSFKVYLQIENEESQRSMVIFPDDTEKIAKEMKAKLTSEAQKLLIEEQLTESPKAGKILAVLKSRFSNISEEHLKMAATRLARNQEGEWKDIVQELHQDNENMKPGAIYKKFSYFPSRGGLELSREYPIHQCIAGSQFYKMMMKWSNACIPVPLRKVSIY